MDRSPLHFAIRFYAGKRQIDTLQTQKGKTYYLLSLPYFLSARIESYLDWLIEEIGDAPSEKLIVEERQEVYRGSPKKQEYSLDHLGTKHLELLRFCSTDPQKGRTMLEEGLGMSYQSRNKRIYIKPLMELGLLAFTIPEHEKSKQQRYRLTEKGRALLKDS